MAGSSLGISAIDPLRHLGLLCGCDEHPPCLLTRVYSSLCYIAYQKYFQLSVEAKLTETASIMASSQSLVESIKAIPTYNLVIYACLALVAFLLLDYLRTAFKPGLRALPGPVFARFSKLYRVVNIARGDCPDFYLRLHQKYGPIVRTGPSTVSLADPDAVPVIYGINHNYLKTAFYDTMTPFYNDTLMPSMFTARDPAYHTSLKRPVSQKFSMTSIKAMEPLADECTSIFLDAMRDLEGKEIDLGVWLQWYAFDVIGAITFQHRFGFLEERRDIGDMIKDIETVLKYAATVGQIPEWHPYLVGNLYLFKFLGWQKVLKVPDPLRTVVRVRSYLKLSRLAVDWLCSSLKNVSTSTTRIRDQKIDRTSSRGCVTTAKRASPCRIGI